jgi:hypothetical protein
MKDLLKFTYILEAPHEASRAPLMAVTFWIKLPKRAGEVF